MSQPPARSLVVTPGAVAVVGLVLIAGLVLAFKGLPGMQPPPAPVAPAYSDLRPRVAELERALATARSAPPPYPDLSGRVASLEATQADLHRELAEAQAAPEYVILNNRLAARESELTATRDALDAARKSDTEARAERDELADRTDRLAREVAQLRADRERMQRLLADTGRQLRRDSASRTGANERETTLANLTDELRLTRAKLTEAQDDANHARGLLAAHQRNSLLETSSIRSELDQLRQANLALTEENQRLKSRARPTALTAAPLAPSSPSPSNLQSPVSPAGRNHVVAAGDTLSRLAERYYGTKTRWPEIYNANSALLGPTGTLRIGMELQIP